MLFLEYVKTIVQQLNSMLKQYPPYFKPRFFNIKNKKNILMFRIKLNTKNFKIHRSIFINQFKQYNKRLKSGSSTDNIVEVEGLFYKLEDNTALVIGLNPTTPTTPPPQTNLTNLFIPDTIVSDTISYDVTGIDSYAFDTWDVYITGTITFGSKITSIGDNAFLLQTSVIGPLDLRNIETIGRSAFDSVGMIYLNAGIAYFDKINYIGDHAFYCCNISTYDFSSKLNGQLTINKNAFDHSIPNHTRIVIMTSEVYNTFNGGTKSDGFPSYVSFQVV